MSHRFQESGSNAATSATSRTVCESGSLAAIVTESLTDAERAVLDWIRPSYGF
jgi:hypothetical protein